MEGENRLYRRARDVTSQSFTILTLGSTPHGRRNMEVASEAITSQGGISTVKRETATEWWGDGESWKGESQLPIFLAALRNQIVHLPGHEI